jgi:hypothetical protein
LRHIGKLGKSTIALLHDILHIVGRDEPPLEPDPEVAFVG